VVSGDGCSSTCGFEFGGACCLPDSCTLGSAADCAAAGGIDQCSLAYAAACVAAGGTYQGDFTACDPNPCVSCGDGAVNQAGEQCDDSNTNDGDGCSSTCQEELCGDGSVNNACEICAPPAEGVVCPVLAPCLNE